MNLENLERVTMLRNHREKALQLRLSAGGGTIEFSIWHQGEKFDPFSVISAEPVRQAIIEACTDFIVKTEADLRALGVAVPKPEPVPSHDLNFWRQACCMYERAWLRCLGGKVLPKSHLIDALVLTTEKMAASAKNTSNGENPTKAAIDLAVRYGGIDGASHKTWVIDQMLRVLAGDRYDQIVSEARGGEDGPETYDWDCGIAP